MANNDSTKLHFTVPFIIIVIFIGLIAMLSVFFSNMSRKRQSDVTDLYVKETENYIAKNKKGLISLFNDIFTEEKECKKDGVTEICTNPKVNKIPELLSSDLKDFSSTIFIKKSQLKLLIMRLSGDISEGSSIIPAKEDDIEKLLRGEKDFLPWDDYTYDLQGKEIVVAVKDESGKTIGAILRGVIEK